MGIWQWVVYHIGFREEGMSAAILAEEKNSFSGPEMVFHRTVTLHSVTLIKTKCAFRQGEWKYLWFLKDERLLPVCLSA